MRACACMWVGFPSTLMRTRARAWLPLTTPRGGNKCHNNPRYTSTHSHSQTLRTTANLACTRYRMLRPWQTRCSDSQDTWARRGSVSAVTCSALVQAEVHGMLTKSWLVNLQHTICTHRSSQSACISLHCTIPSIHTCNNDIKTYYIMINIDFTSTWLWLSKMQIFIKYNNDMQDRQTWKSKSSYLANRWHTCCPQGQRPCHKNSCCFLAATLRAHYNSSMPIH